MIPPVPGLSQVYKVDQADWLALRLDLEMLVGCAVGFSVGVYGVAGCEGDCDPRTTRYQIMPVDEAYEAEFTFWKWHTKVNRQEFPTPVEAGAAFVRAYWRWRKRKEASQ